MPIHLVSPMDETRTAPVSPPPRLGTLSGKTVALLDISKPGGSMFLDQLEQLLKDRYAVAEVSRLAKPTFAKPAPPEIIEKLQSADAVIEALAD